MSHELKVFRRRRGWVVSAHRE